MSYETFMAAVRGESASGNASAHPSSGGSGPSAPTPSTPPPSGDIGGGGRRYPPRRGSSPASGGSANSHSGSPSPKNFVYPIFLATLILLLMVARVMFVDYIDEKDFQRKLRESQLPPPAAAVTRAPSSPYVAQSLPQTEDVKMFQCERNESAVDQFADCFNNKQVLVLSGMHPYRFGRGYVLVRFDRAIERIQGDYAVSFQLPNGKWRNAGPMAEDKDGRRFILDHLGQTLRMVVAHSTVIN